ncbi:MAG: phosphoribosylanthranilate isomerase [Planctomycetota bacterium]|nr:MAG: phosphoribosylanthranilate isomerase [Planctomycetota bacterium]
MAAVEAGADAIGFVFERSSPRHIDPTAAWRLCNMLPPFVMTVGVTRDASLERFTRIEQLCPTEFSQLHGDEDEATVAACGPRVFKAVAFEEGTIAQQLQRWARVAEVDAILVDASSPGSGRPFAWEKLAEAKGAAGDKPLILAGGLTPENVEEAIRIVQPYAVDVSTGVESSPGVKDPARMCAFCQAVREADRALRGALSEEA